jgi:ABC-type glycerol-3-phosphate transport system substrate-binding protein
MKSKRCGFLAAALLTAALCAPAPAALADIVTTDQLTAKQSGDAERAKVRDFLERESVKGVMQKMGIGALAAKARVAAMNDEEVHVVAAKIDSLPAGGNLGSFTNDQLIIVLLVAILVAIIA